MIDVVKVSNYSTEKINFEKLLACLCRSAKAEFKSNGGPVQWYELNYRRVTRCLFNVPYEYHLSTLQALHETGAIMLYVTNNLAKMIVYIEPIVYKKYRNKYKDAGYRYQIS